MQKSGIFNFVKYAKKNVGFLFAAAVIMGLGHTSAWGTELCKINFIYNDELECNKVLSRLMASWGRDVPESACINSSNGFYIWDIFWGDCPTGTACCCGSECTSNEWWFTMEYDMPPTMMRPVLDQNTGLYWFMTRDPDTGLIWQECTACNADTPWENIGPGYQSAQTGGDCSGNGWGSPGTCSNRETKYRCAPEYCGITTDGKTGCALPKDYFDTKDDAQKVECRVTFNKVIDCPDGSSKGSSSSTSTTLCIFQNYPSSYYTDETSRLCRINRNLAPGYVGNMTMRISGKGQTCSAAIGTQYSCAPGYSGQARYSQTSGFHGCKECPSGTYNPDEGASKCTACPNPITDGTTGNSVIKLYSEPTATAVTQCYVGKDSQFSNGRGVYTCANEKCYYAAPVGTR